MWCLFSPCVTWSTWYLCYVVPCVTWLTWYVCYVVRCVTWFWYLFILSLCSYKYYLLPCLELPKYFGMIFFHNQLICYCVFLMSLYRLLLSCINTFYYHLHRNLNTAIDIRFRPKTHNSRIPLVNSLLSFQYRGLFFFTIFFY